MRSNVLAWLSSYDHSSKQRLIFDALHDGTCQWIFEDSQYKLWRETVKTTLWLVGNSGSGKTFTTSRVIDLLHTQSKVTRRRLLYFYCDSNEVSSQSKADLLSSFASQICAYEDPLPTFVNDLYDECISQSGVHHRPTLIDLQKCITELLPLCSVHGLDIVIDAVNESNHALAISDWAMQVARSHQNVKVFLTTIHVPPHELMVSDSLVLRVETTGHTSDIDAFIDSRLQAMPKFQRMSGDMQLFCTSQLKNNANGM